MNAYVQIKGGREQRRMVLRPSGLTGTERPKPPLCANPCAVEALTACQRSPLKTRLLQRPYPVLAD